MLLLLSLTYHEYYCHTSKNKTISEMKCPRVLSTKETKLRRVYYWIMLLWKPFQSGLRTVQYSLIEWVLSQMTFWVNSCAYGEVSRSLSKVPSRGVLAVETKSSFVLMFGTFEWQKQCQL